MIRIGYLSCVVGLSLVISAHAGSPPSTIFRRGHFTHLPRTGQRVAQFASKPAVAAFPDSSRYVSGQRRSRFSQRNADGSVENYYRVESWGNEQPGLNAEWERFHDAWLRSTTAGGYRNDYGYPYGRHPYGQGGLQPAPNYGPWSPTYGAVVPVLPYSVPHQPLPAPAGVAPAPYDPAVPMPSTPGFSEERF